MIALEALVGQFSGLDRIELLRWVENRWVLPERRGGSWVFDELDIARVELILEIRREWALDDEAMPLVLGLLDQVYELGRQLRRLCEAVAAQPAEIRDAIERALARGRGRREGCAFGSDCGSYRAVAKAPEAIVSSAMPARNAFGCCAPAFGSP